jgi:hypothetical protein
MADIPERVLTRVSQVVTGVVSEACKRHYDAPTQEHQFTAKVAQALETELNGANIAGFKILIQDFPDKGPGSWEKRSGADLYISIVYDPYEDLREDDVFAEEAEGNSEDGFDDVVNKGILIQSKWDGDLSASKKKLDEQQEQMLAHSDEAYVWVYEPLNIAVVSAGKMRAGRFDYSDAITVGELVADSLRCTRGDTRLGRDLSLPVPQSIRQVMEELSVGRAIAMTLVPR